MYCEKNKFVAGFATGSILTTIFIVAMSQLNQFATGLTSIIVLSLIAKLAVDLFREKQKSKNLNEKLISQNIDFEEITESLNSIQNNIESTSEFLKEIAEMDNKPIKFDPEQIKAIDNLKRKMAGRRKVRLPLFDCQEQNKKDDIKPIRSPLLKKQIE